MFGIALTLVYIVIAYLVLVKEPKPIFGIYAVPGRWYYVKYIVFSCIYFFRKFANRNKAAGENERAGQGVKAISDPEEMDKPQKLSDDPKAFDAVFFISAKNDPEQNKGIYVIAGSERRPLGMCNGLFYIGMPGKGLMCSKKIPDTVLFGSEEDQFGAEGILITPVTPMKTWRVSYKGPMWYQNDPSKVVNVDFQGEWTATTKHFDFDTDLYPATIIRSIAMETWTREYFEGLKTAHQSHYEQFGEMKCKLSIEQEEMEFTLPSFRDHSFGKKRDWSLMHRYAFHQIFLENGVNIAVGVICQPSTASVFEVGEIALPSGDLLPVKWVDLRLHQHGEQGTPPKDYAFSFKAGDQIYNTTVLVEYESIHYVSDKWEAKMVERFCKYNVNGAAGHGVSEFHYRHTGGRPESVKANDPQWYKDLQKKQ